MKFKAVIFDLDGVLVITDKYQYTAWKTMADEQGIYFDEIIYKRLLGIGRMESLEIVLERSKKKYTQEEKVALANRKNEVFKSLLKTISPNELSEDVKYTLLELKKRGIKISLGSASKNAPITLNRLGIYDWFDAISDGNNITKSKPDPEVFLKAAEFLNEDPKDCLVVEDAFAGIDAGIAGGFKTAGINDASNYERADYKLSKLSDLLDFCE